MKSSGMVNVAANKAAFKNDLQYNTLNDIPISSIVSLPFCPFAICLRKSKIFVCYMCRATTLMTSGTCNEGPHRSRHQELHLHKLRKEQLKGNELNSFFHDHKYYLQ
jgi:hypothetical protein